MAQKYQIDLSKVDPTIRNDFIYNYDRAGLPFLNPGLLSSISWNFKGYEESFVDFRAPITIMSDIVANNGKK